jgi:hypothetical protein
VTIERDVMQNDIAALDTDGYVAAIPSLAALLIDRTDGVLAPTTFFWKDLRL